MPTEPAQVTTKTPEYSVSSTREPSVIGVGIDRAPIGPNGPLVPTLFHEEWWLQAATQGQFGLAEVVSGGKTAGRLPFYVRNKYGFKELRMPPLTYFLGPGIDEGEGSANNRFLKRMDITRELLAKLPATPSQYIKCQRSVSDVIAFQEQGFRTYAQFTHEIPAQAEHVAWAQMRNKTRNVIRRAAEQVAVKELHDAAEFLSLFEANLLSKGMRSDLDLKVSRSLLTAALARGRGRILTASGSNGKVVAANFCAWDSTTCFYVLCTRNDGAGNGATSLLIWEAVKDALSRGLTFDFAGLGTQGSILLYTGFGGTVSTRFVAVRTGRVARLIAEARSLFSRENFFY